MERYDYVIVGAGSAGCAVAEGLSRNGNARILILEAGGSDRSFWVKMPIGYGKLFHDPQRNWRYETAADEGIAGRTSYWPRGKVLGGSSSINAMVYCRGVPSDYEDWKLAGNPGWGWDDVRPVFEAIERRRLGEGFLSVEDRFGEYHPLKRHFLAAAREAGLPICTDMNGPEPEGVGGYQLTTRQGLRHSAADAFLRPAVRRGNVAVLTDAFVERILFEGTEATGVVYRSGNETKTALAAREVILAAGAVNTPKLLQLSGIGPGALLQEMGIEVIRENRSVGANLRDHLGIDYLYRASEPTLNAVLGTWRGRAAAGLRYLLSRSGPLSLSVNQIGGMVRSAAAQARPDIQLYFNPLSYSKAVPGKRRLTMPDRWPGFIMGFNSCRPTSSGEIRIASPDPNTAPDIVPNYLSTDRDIADAIAGARLIARLQATGAISELIAGEPAFDPAAASDDEIVADFRQRAGSVFHPCCTCRMAPEADGGVVDARLRVHGIDRLRVADASVFPDITSANINAPAIMVGYRAGRIISGGMS